MMSIATITVTMTTTVMWETARVFCRSGRDSTSKGYGKKDPHDHQGHRGRFVRIEYMGNPAVNTALIPPENDFNCQLLQTTAAEQ